MNILVVLLWVIIGTVLSVAVLGSLIYAIVLAFNVFDGTDKRMRWRRFAACVVVFLCGLTASAWLIGSTVGDGSEHCASGTHYVSHYYGKTYSWECVAG